MRESTVREYRKGRLGKPEVCDAQSELLRVARNLGRETTTECPICKDSILVHVSFAFGPGLPASGRALGPGDLATVTRRSGDYECYVVEVCAACGWNHLLRMFPVGTSVAKGRARA